MSKYCITDKSCPVEDTLSVIGGKWKVLILWHLYDEGIMRFGELRKVLARITQKMLIQQLRELEEDGLVRRNIYRQVPPRVEYSLTEMGKSIKGILDSMCDWGTGYREYKKQLEMNMKNPL